MLLEKLNVFLKSQHLWSDGVPPFCYPLYDDRFTVSQGEIYGFSYEDRLLQIWC